MSENRKELKDFPLSDQHITHFLLSWDHLMENIVVDTKLLEHFYSNKLLDTNQYENLLELVKIGRSNGNRTRRLIKYLLVNMRNYSDRVKLKQQGAASSSSQPLTDEEDPYDVFMRTLSEMGPSTAFIPLFMNQITVRVGDVNLYNHLFHASSRFTSKSISRFRHGTAHQDLASSNSTNAALNSLPVNDPTNVAPEQAVDRDRTDRSSRGFTMSAEASISPVPSTTTGPSRGVMPSSSSTAATKPKRNIPPPLRDLNQDESSSYLHPGAFHHGAGRTGAFGDATRSSSASRPVRGAGARGVLRQAFTETHPGIGMPAYPTRSPGAPKHKTTFVFEDESIPASSGERTPDEAEAPDENEYAAAAAPSSSISRKQHRRQGSDGRAIGGFSSNDDLFVQRQRQPHPSADELRIQRTLLYALLLQI